MNKPPSRIGGKINPEYRKWYMSTAAGRESIAKGRKKYQSSEKGKKARSKRSKSKSIKRRNNCLKANGFLRNKISAMLRDGWKPDTIVMVLNVPQSVVQNVVIQLKAV